MTAPEANNNVCLAGGGGGEKCLVLPRRPSSLEVKLYIVGLAAVMFQLARFFGGWITLYISVGFCCVLGVVTFCLLKWMESNNVDYDYDYGCEDVLEEEAREKKGK